VSAAGAEASVASGTVEGLAMMMISRLVEEHSHHEIV